MSWQVDEAGLVSGAKAWSFAPGLVARYAFHFQIAKKFGGVVGTELNLNYEASDIGNDQVPVFCDKKGFRPGPSLQFPTMQVGVVQNFLEDRRFLFMVQYGASWFPWMKTCAGELDASARLAAIPHTVAAAGQFDLFNSSGSAWSVGAGLRWQWMDCVGSASVCELGQQKTSLLDRLDIRAVGFFFQAGMTWPTGTESLWRQ